MEISKSNGRSVWDAKIMGHPALWTVTAGSSVTAELRAIAASGDIAALIEHYQPGMFKLDAIAELATRIRRIVDRDIGFCHVTLDDAAELSDDELRLLYLLVSLELGEHCGHYKRLHEVKDKGYDYRKVPVSVSMTKNYAPLHTDCTLHVANPNVIALMCLYPAMTGGESLVVNASTVYDKLKQDHPDLLPALHSDYHRLPVTPWNEKIAGEVNKFPVFAHNPNGELEFRYMRYWLEEGYRELGITMDEQRKRALDVLDTYLDSAQDVVEIPLARGDILFCNNHSVAHSRKNFENSDDVAKQRLLLRMWLNLRK